MPKKNKQNPFLEKILPKPRRKTKSRPMPLFKLEVGDRFEFLSLKKHFRELFVKRVGSGSVAIGGEIKDKVDGVVIWKKLKEGYTVSLNCEVRII